MRTVIIAISILLLSIRSYVAGDMLHFDLDNVSTHSNGHVLAWNQAGDAKVTKSRSADGKIVVQLTASDTKNYLTPMVELKSITVSSRTVLAFQMKCPVAGVYKINLTNQQENAWYNLRFSAEANQWVTFRQYVANSTFGRNFTEGKVINNAL